jgi:hypothetical protein
MISSSYSIVHFVVFIGVKLTSKPTSLEEPTDDSDIAAVVVFSADRPNFVGSERRIEPREPMRKFGLSNVRSISRSKLAKTRVRVGG